MKPESFAKLYIASENIEHILDHYLACKSGSHSYEAAKSFVDEFRHTRAEARLDFLTREHTGFESFGSLINAGGNYRPTFILECTGSPSANYTLSSGRQIPGRKVVQERLELSDAYDKAQEAAGDPRRAYRG